MVLQCRAIYVQNYDMSRYGEYNYGNAGEDDKPHIMIKCTANCIASWYVIKNMVGDTLYTFDSDCSLVPKYIVLGLDANDNWILS